MNGDMTHFFISSSFIFERWIMGHVPITHYIFNTRIDEEAKNVTELARMRGKFLRAIP